MPGRERSFLVSEMSGRAGVHMVLLVEGPHPIPFLAPVAAGNSSSAQQDEWRIPCASGKGEALTSAI